MTDETDQDAQDIVDRLEESLEQLEEQGELDSETITFKTTDLGHVHLDKLDTVLSDVDYDKDPVRITIEPENDRPEDHHYHVSFKYLEHHGPDGYVAADRQARLDGLEEKLRSHDSVIRPEVAEMPTVGRIGGTLIFEVEADIVESTGSGPDHTQYQLPRDVTQMVKDYGGELGDIALYPDGRGLGEPTYAVEVVVE